MKIAEILWLTIALIIVPLAATAVTLKWWDVPKTNKRLWLFFTSILAAVLGWLLSQLFVPLGIASLLVTMLLGSWLLGKVSFLKSLKVAVFFTLIYTIFLVPLGFFLAGSQILR